VSPWTAVGGAGQMTGRSRGVGACVAVGGAKCAWRTMPGRVRSAARRRPAMARSQGNGHSMCGLRGGGVDIRSESLDAGGSHRFDVSHPV